MRWYSGLSLVLLLAASGGQAAVKPWYVIAPKILAPGAILSLTVSTNFTERQDVLVDFLDANTWYAGNRITVEVGPQWEQIVVALPQTVQDPSSTYLAVKILPVDGTWEQALDAKVLPVQWQNLEPLQP